MSWTSPFCGGGAGSLPLLCFGRAGDHAAKSGEEDAISAALPYSRSSFVAPARPGRFGAVRLPFGGSLQALAKLPLGRLGLGDCPTMSLGYMPMLRYHDTAPV